MIKLDVMDYCQGCPMFDAEVDKVDSREMGGRGTIQTTVRCKRAMACREIYRQFQRFEKSKDEFMGPTY